MHIKKLEISGFKSFVDRTVIHFDHDVIGIVGPNGCGKSNIVDALRWCMGEQSAKHLRGRSMEDVIFSGSESRPSHGMAEVVLTFDNSDAEYAASLPEEYRNYGEIGVARRLYRDGTSEYLINGTQVRLRDITDLFLGTGVGTKAYSIVEQGRIGQIVSARPQDRRLFIEEAAGVTKYRQRRRQAERKLELTQQNMLRLSDIVAEIDRNRASLKRQAAKADRFVKYREELEDLSLHQASHRLLELLVVRQYEHGHRTGLAERSDELRRSVEERDTELGKARGEAAAIEARAEEASRRAYEADNRVATLQAEYARGRDRLTHLEERLESSTQQRKELVGRVERLAEEELGLGQRLEQLAQSESALSGQAQVQTDLLARLREEEAATATLAQRLRRSVNDITSRMAGDEVRVQAIVERRVAAEQRHGMLGVQSEEYAQRLASLLEREAETQPRLEEARTAKELAARAQAELGAELTALTPQLANSERTKDAARRELDQRRSRLQALEELERRLEGVKSAAKMVVSSGHPSVVGLFADRLHVPAELTDAIAGLLGDRLETVVAKDPADMQGLLEEIRRGKKGRVSLVPLHPRFVAARGARTLEPSPGVLGRAADLVVYARDDEPLVRALFGDAVIVRDVNDARDVSAREGVLAVSLNGTVVDPTGVVLGGSVAAPQIERRREISELRSELSERTRQVEELEAEHAARAERVASLRSELERAGKAAHESALTLLGAEKDLAQLTREIAAAEKRSNELLEERRLLEKSIEAAQGDEQACRAGLEEASRELDTLRAELEESERTAAASREKAAEYSVTVTEQKVRLAQVTEQREAVTVSLQRVKDSREAADNQSRELAQAAHEAALAYGETAAKLLGWREERIAAEAVARDGHRELETVRSALDDIRNALGVAEEALRGMRAELSEVDGLLGERVMRLQKLEIEQAHLLTGVRERFRGLELGRVVGVYHARPAPDDEHRRRIDELSKLIERMGPVNLDAMAEYEQAEKRFEELSQQKQDIERAVLDLESAVKHMDRESRRRLRDTFKIVNELFSQMFRRMFKGGQAQLVLTDPENILESGVDIVAQPPGKKLGTVELMSGGEKALTAASLIFAIFQHRPSPFCVLDEVDAPLDEANVARYNEAIRSMTDKSQFIVITHIKTTMQSVDLLYGVTMGEPGVSRVVSVKVNDRATPRAQATSARPPRSTMGDALREREREAEEREADTQVA
ncbi:MAG TPA: chromosome segregation protein SMC [Polyangiaceae bacterium]|nr:chromosome segregation protein SMC [Polyangiaceae bacterium]